MKHTQAGNFAHTHTHAPYLSLSLLPVFHVHPNFGKARLLHVHQSLRQLRIRAHVTSEVSEHLSSSQRP